MRILVVTGTFPAITQTFVTREVLAARQSHTVHVLAHRAEPELSGLPGDVQQSAHFLNWREVPIRPWSPATWRPGLAAAAGRDRFGIELSLRRRAYFAQVVADPQIASSDLIHAHWTDLAENVALPLGQLLGVPVTCTVHDSFLESVPTDTLLALQRGLARVMLVSTWSRNLWALRTGSTERLEVVPNGVDIPPVASGRSDGAQLVVVNVARCEPHKRQSDLVTAVARLTARGMSIRCVIIGGGPELPALQRLANDLSISDRCEFTGPLPHEEALRRVASADVFVLPSERESFGVATAEAMAAGIPVVVTEVGGSVDLVEPGLTGYFVPVGDPAAIAERLAELGADPVKRRAMGDAARRKAQVELSFERHMRLMLHAWHAVAADRRSFATSK